MCCGGISPAMSEVSVFAGVRFSSCEPVVGPLDLARCRRAAPGSARPAGRCRSGSRRGRTRPSSGTRPRRRRSSTPPAPASAAPDLLATARPPRWSRSTVVRELADLRVEVGESLAVLRAAASSSVVGGRSSPSTLARAAPRACRAPCSRASTQLRAVSSLCAASHRFSSEDVAVTGLAGAVLGGAASGGGVRFCGVRLVAVR